MSKQSFKEIAQVANDYRDFLDGQTTQLVKQEVEEPKTLLNLTKKYYDRLRAKAKEIGEELAIENK